jgi:hypothetical protein
MCSKKLNLLADIEGKRKRRWGFATHREDEAIYIQITTKCNMRCEHCCFSCDGEGSFMRLETFKAAIAVCHNYNSAITIGGGEPTLHPEFEHFLILAIAATPPGRPFIVTNGSHKERSLLILELTRRGVISGHLSYDQYHDMSMVDDVVFDGFRTISQGLWGGDMYGYRKESTLVAAGRARPFVGARKGCACESTFVQPSGIIRQCGCPHSPKIGHVKSGRFDSSITDCCYNGEEYKLARAKLEEELQPA